MQKLIGSEVKVFLKKECSGSVGDISGFLIDANEKSLYVQGLDNCVYAIPHENVAYCATNELPVSERHIVGGPVHSPTMYEQQQQKAEEEPQHQIIDKLNVYVNKQQVTSIPIPPTFPIQNWSDKILRVIMGNPEVKAAIAGKIQKEIKYYPGEVYIDVEQITPPSQMPESQGNQNTFSMGSSGSPAVEYLNPSQMVSRLNNAVGGGNDDKTNM